MSPTPSERNATFQLKRALKAEDECRALQARVAELEDELGSSTTYTLNELQAKVCGLAGERDRLKSELAEIHKQEPVSHRYRFIHPISGEPVWRDSSSTWNGQCVQEVQQLFAAPIPPVREPLSDNAIAALRQAIVQPATTEWTVIAPDGTRFTGPTPLKAALPASKYRLEIDPVAAVKFMEIIDQEAEKGRQEAEQCMRDYGTLDCPACGGSGHIGDVKQPAQVPAELSLNIIRKWPDGFQKRLDHVWKDVDGFIPNVKLYDLQRTLAEFGFTMKVYEQAAQEVK